MITGQVDKNKKGNVRKVERQHEEFFSPFPQVLLNPEGSLAQPSPYLNIWGVQASDSGEEPIFEENSNNRS